MNGRILIGLAAAAVLAGCQTPADVRQAHRWEREAIVAYRADNQALAEAFLSDLQLAWEKQVELVQGYEVRLRTQDGRIEVVQLQSLLEGARAKLAEIRQKIEAIRGKVARADTNYTIALRLHDSVDEWLGRKGISEEEQAKFLDQAARLAGEIQKKKSDKE